MNTELTEEEMRRALFGESESPAPAINSLVQDTAPDVVVVQHVKAAKKQKVSKGFTPRLRVTLRVGNEFEGKTHEIVHEADTLSALVAEQEATRTARKNSDLWKWYRSSRSAYNRAAYIERRRSMMSWWSEHVPQATTGSLFVSAIQGSGGVRKALMI